LNGLHNLYDFREGKLFCKVGFVPGLEINLSTLKRMEKMLQGDFLANDKYIALKYKTFVSFVKLEGSNDLEIVDTGKSILGITISEYHASILHEFSISILNLQDQKLRTRHETSTRQISIVSNSRIVAALNEERVVSVFFWKGKMTF